MNIKRYRQAAEILDIMPDGRIFAGAVPLTPNAHGKFKIGELKNLWLHILVAVAFVPNSNDFRFVKRINNDPTSDRYNHKDNLYWSSAPHTKKKKSFNVFPVNRIAKKKGKKLRAKQVQFIRESEAPYKVLAKKFNCTVQTIQYIRSGHTYSKVPNADGSTFIPKLKTTWSKKSNLLSLDDVYVILENVNDETDALTAERFKVAITFINRIRNGRAFKQITIPWLKERGLYVERKAIGRPRIHPLVEA